MHEKQDGRNIIMSHNNLPYSCGPLDWQLWHKFNVGEYKCLRHKVNLITYKASDVVCYDFDGNEIHRSSHEPHICPVFMEEAKKNPAHYNEHYRFKLRQ